MNIERIYTEEDLEDIEEELEKLNCPFCIKVGLYIPLGPKILLPNEIKQPDYENWLQCSRCAEIIPIYQAEKEETIKDSVETVDSPFDNKFQIETIPKRNSKAGKIQSAKKRRNKIKSARDKDIELEIKNVGEDNVKVIQEK